MAVIILKLPLREKPYTLGDGARERHAQEHPGPPGEGATAILEMDQPSNPVHHGSRHGVQSPTTQANPCHILDPQNQGGK